MKTRTIFATILMAVLAHAEAFAQGHKTITDKGPHFTAYYDVLESDTTVRDGDYKLTYKGRVVESGQYDAGQRVGEWTFTNLEKLVELKYNYSLGQPTHILPHTGKTYNQNNYPSIFLGSPIVPSYFLMANTFYPRSEVNNPKGGRVVLTILVGPDGIMTGYKIKNASKQSFAKAVTKAADQIPRDEWRWVPALKNGKNVASEYDIVLVFGK